MNTLDEEKSCASNRTIYRNSYLRFVLSFLMFFPAGTAFAGDARSLPQYGGTTVEANGKTLTWDVWPKSILQNAWQHCSENGCDGVTICVAKKDIYTFYGTGQGQKRCKYPSSIGAKFSGNYSGGWATRNNFVNALLEFGEKNGGWHDSSPIPLFDGSWATRSFWAVRSPNGWMNVNVEGSKEAIAACGN